MLLAAALLAIINFACSGSNSDPSYTVSARLNRESIHWFATADPAYNEPVSIITEGPETVDLTAVISTGSDWCSFNLISHVDRVTRKAGSVVHLYCDANMQPTERTAVIDVDFADGTRYTLRLTQSGYSVSASYDHAWAELPEYEDNSDYIYKTYYTTLTGDTAPRRNYTICYDSKKHISHWSAYPVHERYMGRSGRAGEFCFDPNDQLPIIPQSIQQNVEAGGYNDGANRGLDRGHMLPSASRTRDEACNWMTFYATNMMPQASQFNQNSWATLEGAVRSAALSGSYAALADTVYVVTGTHFAAGYETIVSRGVSIAVPTHAWKVLLRAKERNREDNDITKLSADQLLSIGFIYENSNSSRYTTFAQAACSVEEIERLTGFKFWKMLPEEVAVQVKKQKNLSDWGNVFK